MKPPCAEYSVARAQELVVIPEGAVWGGRDDQPREMRKGVVLKREKGIDDGEAEVSDTEHVDDDDDVQAEMITLLREIKDLVGQLVELKRKEIGETAAQEVEQDELLPSEDDEKEPPLTQPKRKRKFHITFRNAH